MHGLYRAGDLAPVPPRAAAGCHRPPWRRGRGAREHDGGVRRGRVARLSLSRDGRARVPGRRRGRVPRSAPRRADRPARRDRQAADRRDRGGGRGLGVLTRRREHVPLPRSRRAGPPPRGAAVALARGPREHRPEGRRERRAARRTARQARCVGPRVPRVLLRPAASPRARAQPRPRVHVDGPARRRRRPRAASLAHRVPSQGADCIQVPHPTAGGSGSSRRRIRRCRPSRGPARPRVDRERSSDDARAARPRRRRHHDRPPARARDVFAARGLPLAP